MITRGEGDFFGDVGQVAGERRTATMRARTDTVFIELARRSAKKLITSVAPAREIFERMSILRQLQDHLAADIFDEELEPVIATAELKSFKAGQKLAEEGAKGDRSVHFIRSGSVTLSRKVDGKDVVVAYEAAGRFVGEIAIFYDVPRPHTITAAINTETLRIDGAAFETLLRRHPELRQRFKGALQQRQRLSAGKEQDPRYGPSGRAVRAHRVRRGHRRPPDRRILVHPLRQLREGLRGKPRRRLAPGPRGGADRGDDPRADLVPALRAPALHGRLPAQRAAPGRDRRGLDRGHLHRLRQLRRRLPLRRDPHGRAGRPRSRAC